MIRLFPEGKKLKLVALEVRNFRSIPSSSPKDGLSMSLSKGCNVIVGPNNTGKTNILSALELAMTPEAQFDGDSDLPSFEDQRSATNVKPSIGLSFQLNRRVSSERTLLGHLTRLAEDRGTEFDGLSPFRVLVRYARENGSWVRREEIQVGGTKRGPNDVDLLDKALKSFWFCLRFVRVSSGGIADQATVNKLVTEAMKSTFSEEFGKLNDELARLAQDVRRKLADPLSEKLSERMTTLFPEDLQRVVIGVPPIMVEGMLENTSLQIVDHTRSGPDQKGSGVKSGYQLALLGYLAESMGRSLILALDEPEAFLHPAAQLRIASDLEDVASNRNVSLLYTSHSPYAVSRSADARIFRVEKRQGRTRIAGQARGDENLAEFYGPLYGQRLVDDATMIIGQLRPDAVATVIVEGKSDKVILEAAIRKLGLAKFEKVDFFEADGAKNAVYWGIVINALRAPRPSLVLLDKDPPTADGMLGEGESPPVSQRALDVLNGELGTKGSANAKRSSAGVGHKPLKSGAAMSVIEVAGSVKRLRDATTLDIEDLFSPSTIKRFAKSAGRPGISSSAGLVEKSDKINFSSWLRDQGTEKDFADIAVLLERIATRIGLNPKGL
jgi:ABC-type multidrug transport system ATPase subunit